MNLNDLIYLYSNQIEPSVITDEHGKILFSNICAKSLFNDIDNILNLEPFFTFDVGVLNTDMILSCNPIRLAFNSKEQFYTECIFQQTGNVYRHFCIRSLNLFDYKIFILNDITALIENEANIKSLNSAKQEINKLKVNNKEVSILKQRAEAQSIKTALVNRISIAIRDSLDIDEILYTAVKELSVTIGAACGIFASFHQVEQQFEIKQYWGIKDDLSNIKLVDIDKDTITKVLKKGKLYKSNVVERKINIKSVERLVIPVIHQHNLLGILIFCQTSPAKKWHTEEISFVENIASQLATALKQASLFTEISDQKVELQKTLKELQETQLHLVQSEKMASIGQLVAGVAHEINTPLASIKSNNSMLDMFFKSESGNFDLEMLNNIIGINSEAISRIDKIVKSLKTFARLDEALLAEYDLHDGINSTLDLIHHEIKNRIKVLKQYDLNQKVNCFPDLLNQVFMNVLVNAYQSIDGNGTITIKTSINGPYAIISITDDGCGISPDFINKVFDPGFTTKGVGVGTGLGLAISYKIIKKHNGEIKVTSKEKIGTTFEIQIPLEFKSIVTKC